jgi:hypothetical protein
MGKFKWIMKHGRRCVWMNMCNFGRTKYWCFSNSNVKKAFGGGLAYSRACSARTLGKGSPLALLITQANQINNKYKLCVYVCIMEENSF